MLNKMEAKTSNEAKMKEPGCTLPHDCVPTWQWECDPSGSGIKVPDKMQVDQVPDRSNVQV